MKKIGLVLILVEIVALLIMGRQTAYVPSRPQIDAIQLHHDPADIIDEEIDKSAEFLQGSIFPNPSKSIKTALKIYFSYARQKSIVLAINAQ